MSSLGLVAATSTSQRALDLLTDAGIHLAQAPEESSECFTDRLDTSLMALFRDQRRPEVFESLYQRTRGRVFDGLRRFLSERGIQIDPLEVLQDTFVNVYRYAGGFRDEHAGSFRAWVRTIAHHAVARAAGRRLRRSLQALPEGIHEPEDRQPRPARVAEDGEEERSLSRTWMLFLAHYSAAFESLSPRDQRALEMIEVQGLSYQETARILGVGRSNMKMILFRARLRLQSHMARSLGASPPIRARASA